DGVTVPARAFLVALPPAGDPDVSVTIGAVHATGPLVLAIPSGGDRSARLAPPTVRLASGSLADGAAPSSPVIAAYVTQLRAQRVLRLVLAPTAYVAATGTLLWTDALDVTVRFPTETAGAHT